MILKSIKLSNIRSYTSEVMNFPEGSVLLAGDIGSGKSTILMAIEFALFGIRRVHLSGASLLRHGKREGFVELGFDINGKEVYIKRTLKRQKDSVKQEAGFVITDSIKKEGTAVELKSMVLDLLGYPKDLLTRSRDLIYRYTVFTPQDEMKAILIEDSEVRLDTLRKVFQIDKYKRIRENCSIFIKELREKQKELEGRIADLQEKKEQKNERENEVKSLGDRISASAKEKDRAEEEVKQRKKSAEKYEADVRKLNDIKKDIEKLQLMLNSTASQISTSKSELGKTENQIAELKKEVEANDIPDKKSLRSTLKLREEELEKAEDGLRGIREKIAELNTRKKSSEDIREKIAKIDKCPLCEQNVSHEHKTSINDRENSKVQSMQKELSACAEKEQKSSNKLIELKKQIELLRKKQASLDIIELKISSLKEKQEQKIKIEQQSGKLKREVGDLNRKKLNLDEQLKSIRDVEKLYLEAKKELDKSLEKEKQAELQLTSLKKEAEGIQKLIDALEKEIEAKLKTKEKIKSLSSMKNWLEEYFIKLMSLMERHVMLAVHSEFNSLFQEWFRVLIADETISVRLDEEFTPVIEQNGYETFYENLSGGERTSCALAYRLALNRVINDIVSNIKTNDIIILDEPTEGFSTEQLDRVRDVIDQISIKQVIIVSHESKIESFVDNIIRIAKTDHVSHVMS